MNEPPKQPAGRMAYPVATGPANRTVAHRPVPRTSMPSTPAARAVTGLMAGTIAVVCLGVTMALVSPSRAFGYGTEQFPCPPPLDARVNFWVRIFTEFGKDQRVIHDTRYPWVIYEIADVTGLSQPQVKLRVARRKDHYATLLEHMAGRSPVNFNQEEKRVADLLVGVPEAGRYALPRERIRSQSGVRDSFLNGLRRSGIYRPAVEAILDSLGVPRELAYLPHVESGYHPGATSKAGAKGLWQFMPSTGKRFLRVERDLDERVDPIRATEAAARYLLDAHATVGTWPLAVVSYNHGIGGILRARSKIGCTDIDRILLEYDGPAFGFASQNFYCEFLAAMAVAADPSRYFGAVHFDPPLACAEFPLPDPVRWDWLLRAFSVESEQLAALNPAVGRYYTSGRRPLPRGYILRLPPERTADAAQRWTVVPASARLAVSSPADGYRVLPGDTLGSIATRHGVSLATLLKANGLRATAVIRPGQLLTLPGAGDRGL
jgi:membrane-bound lytic murein transglycosylase D